MTVLIGSTSSYSPASKVILVFPASIAAASVLAKVSRDRYMERLHDEYPVYNWARNAGYLTKEHLDAIDKYGLTKYHRPSFLKKHFAKQLNLF